MRNIRSYSVIVTTLGLAAIILIAGCSNDNTNPMAHSQSDVRMSPINDSRSSDYNYAFEGTIEKIDAESRVVQFSDGTDAYVAKDAIVVLPNDDVRSDVFSNLKIGAFVAAYGRVEGRELPIIERLEVNPDKPSVDALDNML